MKWIAVISPTYATFHSFVKNLIGEEEYNLSVKSLTQICGPDLTKYVRIENSDNPTREWNEILNAF